ncbi:hypothetical protein [Acidovorax sp. SUPP3334]|uniref:hypothetical protein n=1 Tax=Acidovorax sp. SUPP3334 TaxID=2920881 RepID=UPI0023DE24AF|nr:hypothetical protein [Acidovorax sp. SUPP3334]GKT25972.1 hypothetical protein AVHM3334_19650 [Acidovorax sp. SUPP3334]
MTSGAEIAFLLGFEDPNSLIRAFQGWTGATPNAVRLAHAASKLDAGTLPLPSN